MMGMISWNSSLRSFPVECIFLGGGIKFHDGLIFALSAVLKGWAGNFMRPSSFKSQFGGLKFRCPKKGFGCVFRRGRNWISISNHQ